MSEDVRKRLVLRVNELYHDAENKSYEGIHPEIFRDEASRWQKFAEQYFRPTSTPRTVLDFGCGTGFVGLQLLPYLSSQDTLISADLSAQMLKVCQSNIINANPSCDVLFHKINESEPWLPKASFDIIVLNSVLHHVPDIHEFSRFVNEMLAPNGIVAMAHEPNTQFYDDRALRFLESFVLFFTTPGKFIKKTVQRMGFAGTALKLSSNFNTNARRRLEIYDYVNDRLLDEKLVSCPLTINEISTLVDFHMPGKTGGHNRRGFDISRLQSEYFPQLEIVHFETYNHVGRPSTTSIGKWLSKKLKKIKPRSGAQMFLVLCKPDSEIQRNPSNNS